MYKIEKRLIITLAFIFVLFINLTAHAAEAVKDTTTETKDAIPAKIEVVDQKTDDNIDFSKYKAQSQQDLDKNSRKEIESTIYKLNKYANNQNFNAVKELISDSYINNDGFDKKSYLELMKHSWELYPKLKYAVTIKDVSINGDHARVTISDEAVGKLSNPNTNLEKTGIIKTTSESVVYLQRYGYDWKIQSEMITDEKTVLAYSDAQFMKMDLFSPSLVSEDAYYTAKLKVDIPKEYVLFASINNEKITFPQDLPKEVFKTISSDGTLERVLRANDEKKNEYTVASIGITRPMFNKDNSVSVKITGMAFIMSRVNTIKEKQEYTL